MPFSPMECFGHRMTILYEYNRVEQLKPTRSSEHINLIKSSEDVCIFLFLPREGVLQSSNLFFPSEFGILKRIDSSL